MRAFQMSFRAGVALFTAATFTLIAPAQAEVIDPPVLEIGDVNQPLFTAALMPVEGQTVLFNGGLFLNDLSVNAIAGDVIFSSESSVQLVNNSLGVSAQNVLFEEGFFVDRTFSPDSGISVSVSPTTFFPVNSNDAGSIVIEDPEEFFLQFLGLGEGVDQQINDFLDSLGPLAPGQALVIDNAGESAFLEIGPASVSFDGVFDGFEITGFVSVTPIPEPASLALAAAGGMLMAGRRRSA